MALAPWRSPLARALHRNRSRPDSRYLQLATLRADGRPANRTVVFRGFREEGDDLLFITDARSDKVPPLASQPDAEACWYFPTSREQFRLSGTVVLITAQEPEPALQAERQRLWQAQSERSRQSFTWPTPGQPRQETGFDRPLPADPPAAFAVLILTPTWVDHLELRGHPQQRYRYDWTGDRWTMQAINP
ncbi:MAG: Npun_F5749 family FMN-dependent PPOX-type flavoprotein [Leptolyngbya sp.]|nr:Npun_F5749 family FMN-dependent PPOX-type flavoprotein [Leptolyngbya sp.]